MPIASIARLIDSFLMRSTSGGVVAIRAHHGHLERQLERQGAMKALVLALGLRVIGTAVRDPDPEAH